MSRSSRLICSIRPQVILDKTCIRSASTLAVSQNLNVTHPRCRLHQPHLVMPYRNLFQLPKLPNPLEKFANKKIDYTEKQIIGYSMEQIYEVVSCVENYQQFVPWCTSSTVNTRSPTFISADMVIGFPPVTESYTSNITLRHPHYIKAECRDGKLFNFMETTWRFSPGLPDNARTCTMDLSVSFEFCSALHSRLAKVVFDEVARTMSNAFLQRAESCFGKGSIKSQPVDQYLQV